MGLRCWDLDIERCVKQDGINKNECYVLKKSCLK